MECKKCGAIDTPHYPNDRTCKECRKAKVRANRADRIEYYRAYDRERGYREYCAEKARSRRAVRSLERPEGCSKCDHIGKVEGHHEDYSKPLDVIWLCKPCHTQLHILWRELV